MEGSLPVQSHDLVTRLYGLNESKVKFRAFEVSEPGIATGSMNVLFEKAVANVLSFSFPY